MVETSSAVNGIKFNVLTFLFLDGKKQLKRLEFPRHFAWFSATFQKRKQALQAL